ncbi:octaprenyl-diphosphate synthase [Desulfonatronum thiosulfatophilum]|uniref:Octaprenyl-diphosphate synthase n=2 Tax=Desulfonatronum thiosulfatophilum TaxID=617002 RepID=A0A1G6D6P0_9BACT|nr:octaprenyl-diphosphate synthase [Desulfonatronum thiosulfatophilum]
MHHLQQFFKDELPVINDYLGRETRQLPELVRPVAEHVLRAGGKRLRPLLTILFSRCFSAGKKSPDPLPASRDIYPLACAMEFLHSATLLHDDILDGSDLRRGQTTAHLIFGRTETILAGDVLLALGNRLVAEYGDTRLSWRVADAIMRTASGEIQELEWIKNPTLSQEHYLEIITGKTAYLIQASCHCGALVSNSGPAVEQAALDFGINLGIAFQLTDDALDYSAKAEVAGKPVGNDLREGKLTLPLISYLESIAEHQRHETLAWIRDLGATSDHGVLSDQNRARHDQIIQAVRSTGCVQQTLDRAAHFVSLADNALSNLEQTRECTALREALHHTLHREK